jgi:hypothetical protein
VKVDDPDQRREDDPGAEKEIRRVAVPIPISHPMLALAGVTKMVVLEIDWPERQDDMSWVMTWTCIQHAPPPKKQNVSYPMQGDLLNEHEGTLETGINAGTGKAYGPAIASTTSPQLPQPPSATPTKP